MKKYFIVSFIALICYLFLTVISNANAQDTGDKKYIRVPLEVKNSQVIYRINDYSPTLVSSTSRINLSYMRSKNAMGAGYSVAVIDTGVEASHPFLSGRVVHEACFTFKNSCPNNSNAMIGPGAAKPVHWHGTHVAGIIAGKSPDVFGVASAANIVAVNIFEKSGISYEDSLIQGLEHVLSVKSTYNIVSVNLSLGTSKVWLGYCDDVLPQLTNVIKRLTAANIAVVAAAGNSFSHGMSNPACVSSVVGVAASYITNDAVTDFSNISRYTAFAAPGYQILSSTNEGSGYKTSSGTSMAAPHVAGAFAAYFSLNSKFTVAERVANLQTNCPKAYDGPTQLQVCRLDFAYIASGQTAPVAPTTTTTTTLPVSTTTTVVRNTPTTTTTVVYNTQVGKPRLTRLSYSSRKQSLTIVYVDVLYGKQNLSGYRLVCNEGSVYNIPLSGFVGSQTYEIGSFSQSAKSCYLQSVGLSGSVLSATVSLSVNRS